MIPADVPDSQEAHCFDKCTPCMSEGDSRVVRKSLFQQYMAVKPGHLLDGEDPDGAKRLRSNVQYLSLGYIRPEFCRRC